jgi:hypothetical protein
MPSYIKGATFHWLPDMTDIVVVYKATGSFDAYGKRSTNVTGVTYTARIMSDETKITTDQKRTTVEEGTLIIMDDPDIHLGDRLVLPNGNEPVVKRVDRVNYNANGTTIAHHTKIAFGRA